MENETNNEISSIEFDEPTRPPTANFTSNCAAKLLRGLVKGEISYQAAMGGAKLVDAVARNHANKLTLLRYTSKMAPKSLLREMSLDV